MSIHSFRTFDGLNLSVRRYGPPEPDVTVVLAHCWTADHEDWHYQVRDLQHHFGHRIGILSWDHRGHGQSDPAPLADCTIDNLARDMADLIDAHAPGGSPLVLAGHSIGGMTMMAIGENHPEVMDRVRGAMFCSTSAGNLKSVTLGLPDMGERAKFQLPSVLAQRARILGRSARRKQPRIERMVVRRFLFGQPMRLRDHGLVVDQLINCPPATMEGFFAAALRHDRFDALKAFDGIPTRVLVGEKDLLTPADHARRITGAIRTSTLVLAPGAGHMLPLERDKLVSSHLIQLIEGALPR
ncbi:alpha/beta fold hydrolase [Nocardioides limicola]|uniref:alpha/beta fold hydrolase n=1 Tax=Nocardioides limicola TaxID=2803368 RepID=UPI00193BA4A8|nr:alpha/beta hydrolase [Nocardioides sp. DJM-14]